MTIGTIIELVTPLLGNSPCGLWMPGDIDRGEVPGEGSGVPNGSNFSSSKAAILVVGEEGSGGSGDGL